MTEIEPYFIDPKSGERFYNARRTTQIVEGVSEPTMNSWMAEGETSFGLKLHIRREPIMHEPRSGSRHAKTHREYRLLIPEAEVFAIREHFQAVGRTKPGPWTNAERDSLQGAVIRRQLSAPIL